MKNNFENIVNNLQQMQVDAPQEVWEKLDKNLPKKNKKRFFYLILMLLGLLTFSVFYFKSNSFLEQNKVAKTHINNNLKQHNSHNENIRTNTESREGITESSEGIIVSNKKETTFFTRKQSKFLKNFTVKATTIPQEKSLKEERFSAINKETTNVIFNKSALKIPEETTALHATKQPENNINVTENQNENTQTSTPKVTDNNNNNESNSGLQTKESAIKNTEKEQVLSLKNVQVVAFYTQYLAQHNAGNQSSATAINAKETWENFSRKYGVKINLNISKKATLSLGCQMFNYQQEYQNINIDTINTHTQYTDLAYENNFGISSEAQEFPSAVTQQINYSGFFVEAEYKWLQQQKLSLSSAISVSVMSLNNNELRFKNEQHNARFANAKNLKQIAIGTALQTKIQYNFKQFSIYAAPEIQYFSPTENRNFNPLLLGIQFGILWNF